MASTAPSSPSQLDSGARVTPCVPLAYAQQPRRSRVTREDREDSLTFSIPKFRLRTAAAMVVLPYAGGWCAMAVTFGILAAFIPLSWKAFGDKSVDMLSACALMLAIVLIPAWLFRRRREVRITRDGIQLTTSSIFDDRTVEWRIDEITEVRAIGCVVVLLLASGDELGRIPGPSGDEAIWMAGVIGQRLRIGGGLPNRGPAI